MTGPKKWQLEDLLQRPEVQKATSNINPELMERRLYQPPVCDVFSKPFSRLEKAAGYHFEIDREAKQKLPKIINADLLKIEGIDTLDAAEKAAWEKPRKIGIVFSGGPAPGGHNVIAGLFDAAKKANPSSRIFGFLVGPDGIIEGEAIELTDQLVDNFRNLGGFTMIKTGRTKIDTPKKMELSRETILDMGLDALVVVGGDDSNTNAAFLAEALYDDGVQVIGVPKTIDGDIQVKDAAGKILCAMSFGFHTAARAFSQSISNLSNDCSSDIKYWHICKVMGRVASHLALEVALQTHANLTFIGEDLADYVDVRRLEKAQKEGTVDYTAFGMTLRHLSRVICNVIMTRAKAGKNYGVVVIPEGVLEFINEIQVFIVKLNTIIAHYNDTHDRDFHTSFPRLEEKLEYLRRLVRGIRSDIAPNIWNARDDEWFNDIPEFFQEGLLTERDSHGNFQFSQVPTEKVILDLVKDYLKILQEKGRYVLGIKPSFFTKTLTRAGLNPDRFGPVIFNNYGSGDFLVRRDTIFSFKTLKAALNRSEVLEKGESLPEAIKKIFEASVPKFKTQTHFYGYDGRGADPTRFDCKYTYNLGLTVFSLIAQGATGHMAAIRNLQYDFERWEPMGIPIAPMMRLEERKGKLALVLEKSLVDLESPAFKVVEANRERWLAATPGPDHYRRPGPIRFAGRSEEDRPITLFLNALAEE